MFSLYRVKITLLATAAMLPLFTHAATAESMPEAIAFSMQKSPTIEAAHYKIKIADQQFQEKYADLFPQISVNAEIARAQLDTSTTRGLTVERGSANTWTVEGGGSITQTLFDGYGRSNRLRVAQTDHETAQEQFSKAQEDVRFEVILAYLSVMQAREVLAQATTNTNRVAQHVDQLKVAYDSGALDELSYRMAQEALLEAQKAIVTFNSELIFSQAQYERVVGHSPEGEMNLEAVPLEIIPQEIERAIDIAKQKHPSVVVAQSRMESASHNAEAQRSVYFPTVQAAMSYNRKDQDDKVGGESLEAKALLRMNWNISVAGGERAKVRQAVYKKEQEKVALREVHDQLTQRIREAYASRDAADQTFRLSAQTVEMNAELMKNYENQFKLNKVNRIQIIQAENKLLVSRIKLINARYRKIANQYAVIEAMGSLGNALALAPQPEL